MTKKKHYTYSGKKVFHQIEDLYNLDYEVRFENAQVSVKFTEVHDYSAFTPYEFGCKPTRVIVNSAYSASITDYLVSPGVGTVLYFSEGIKDKISSDVFYTVKIYIQPELYFSNLMEYAQRLFMQVGIFQNKKK